MKIYLDTGNIEEIKKAADSGLIEGVTTNPSLIAKEGKDFKKLIKDITQILKIYRNDFTLSAEVTAENAEDMVEQGRELAKIDKHIIVKIPLTYEGLKAVNILAAEEIKCNVTLCFSTNQALLAAKAGAWCVSPFIGRIDDEGMSGIQLIRDIRQVYDNYNFETKILAASIRSTEHVFECAKAKADIITMPYEIFQKMYYSPLTDIGLAKFKADWEKYEKKVSQNTK